MFLIKMFFLWLLIIQIYFFKANTCLFPNELINDLCNKTADRRIVHFQAFLFAVMGLGTVFQQYLKSLDVGGNVWINACFLD